MAINDVIHIGNYARINLAKSHSQIAGKTDATRAKFLFHNKFKLKCKKNINEMSNKCEANLSVCQTSQKTIA